MRTKTALSLITLAFLLLTAVIVLRLSQDPEILTQFQKKSITGMNLTIHTTRVTVAVADTEATRTRGLSGRASLPFGTGLLMKFDEDTLPGIWMKDMNFAIDVIWIDKNWKVVSVTPSIGPESFPAVFYPDAPIRYVLEVPAGFADIYNIKAGDIVEH